MSHIATTWAWKQDVGTPVRKLMLLHLADSANPDTGNISYYSIKRIAERCNCSKSTVTSNMKWLESEGYITLIRQGNRLGQTNCYRVNVGDVIVQDGPGEPIPADGHPIPGAGIDLYREPVHPIPGAGPITVNRTVNRTVKKKKRVFPSVDDEQMVLNLYHEILPELPTVQSAGWEQSETRENLRKIWNSDERCRNPDFWVPFFHAVRAKEYWMTGNSGKPIESARLAWLLTPSKYKAVITRALELDEAAA